jgi:hypothetical protein
MGNDVTGRVRTGEAGLVVEIDDPVWVHTFVISRKWRWRLQTEGPLRAEESVTQLMENQETGKVRDDVLNEKVFSAIIEMKTELERIPEFLRVLEKVQREIDTVISVGVASKCLPDGTIPHEEWVKKAGYALSANGKTNLGLGRPLFREYQP